MNHRMLIAKIAKKTIDSKCFLRKMYGKQKKIVCGDMENKKAVIG